MNGLPDRAAALRGALIAIAGLAYWTDDRMASAEPASMPVEP